MTLDKNEIERLKILSEYQIMDTGTEKIFDDLTSLAVTICEAPISLVSLVDDRRQWFKSSHGLDACETPREQAFCAHAMKQDDIMLVEDASMDPRFAENPLVTSGPLIRFYAGTPLVSREGQKLGTLCVIDQRPRRLTDYQLESLRVLGRAVESQLELKRSRAEFREMSQLLPMCSWCNSIRLGEGNEGSWQPLKEYLEDITPVTHGICPS